MQASLAGDGPLRGPRQLEQLVMAMMAGELDALSRFYDLTVRHVFYTAHGELHSREDAEEIVVDVFYYVWRNAHVYDVRRGSVRAWLSIIARSRAIDRLRQRRVSVPLTDDDDEPLADSLVGYPSAPEQMLAVVQSSVAVNAALDSLSAERRTLVHLAFFEGHTHNEIAVALGLPLGTVKSHIRRALVSMQAQLLGHA